ncbi:uncharacterized protein MONBRDRAFT_28793 [Monosiga brevicollis MX1]|uniref:FAM50A/XAP5 C-terminal domain-containing protein n=1 Tax=Monosiga brevicollis TaxID=81824 RepID=A9V9G2_MONBE|nr:uncharacterized protein MONBRDRAFT_28793 [Monosiga brevicollis MX1]EDQ85791.1 predicted protein [Monosiga brevicollis MX1]|eukprot:XP_001749270.1 hypothetical protein [Monosiga brevicollis MX1]
MSQYTGPAQKGRRAIELMRQREKREQELKEQTERMEQEQARHARVAGKFETRISNAAEAEAAVKTYGLVTLDQMKAVQAEAEAARARKVADALAAEEAEAAKKAAMPEPTKKRTKAKVKVSLLYCIPLRTAVLSFGGDEEEEEDEAPLPPKKRLGKNPEVDTSFLPDREREEQERLRREELRKEWVEKQEEMRNEPIEITYSYWDGSGNRRTVQVAKGNSIGQFLQAALKQLRADFPELRAVSADSLVYVKEDLIMPHHHTFYDLIVSKARGKSGPLFHFDVHDDVRLQSDVRVEKEESHAGKVCLRSWYERHKHIFPASRWEPYDPTKDYGSYTISDGRKP